MNNPYSKFRYDDRFKLKNRLSITGPNRTFGCDLRSFSDITKRQISGHEPWSNLGVTWVTNYIYTTVQANKVDGPVVDDPIAPTRKFFKLFKL